MDHPKMKMTTEIPPGIATPDHIDSVIGPLNFFDGVPDVQTVEAIYDNLDFQRGVQAYLSSIQIASMSGMRRGILAWGPANTTALLFEDLMDSTTLFLTPNTTSVYMTMWLDLSDGPMVIETPPNVLGLIDDFWFHYVADFGNVGPDRGAGGKFVILPPGYEGDVPDGYHVAQSDTFGNWIIWRGFQVDGSPAPAIADTKSLFRVYPLGADASASDLNFINVSGKTFNTIHHTDFGLYEEVNEVVQEEPPHGQDPEILGLLASIGIRKGKQFAPGERMRRILESAAEVGAATARTLTSFPRDEDFYFYPGEGVWTTPFPGGSYEFLDDGVRVLDARTFFHFYATGITPAMTMAPVGAGSQYAATYVDGDGAPLDGAKTYVVHVPPNAPANQFWSFVVYDNQTRAMLQTDEPFPSKSTARPGLEQNEDGSYDVFFGPVAPDGKEANWIQTVPGKGWNVLFRLYGPLQPWFDKTWRPGDPQLVD